LKGDEMASYDFECELDGIFDRNFSMGDAPASIPCPVCGDDAKRKFAPTLSIFKGRGWGSKP
jgi:predicted nucleic acid-binding Zn ribbon protein